MSDSIRLVRAWKQKAEQDLLAARVLLAHGSDMAEIIGFHAQQAVEKSLKGFLIYHGHIQFPKTHDVGNLLRIASTYEPKLEDLDEVVELTPFAVEVRYPEMDATGIDAEEYLVMAERACQTIWSYVEGL